MKKSQITQVDSQQETQPIRVENHFKRKQPKKSGKFSNQKLKQNVEIKTMATNKRIDQQQNFQENQYEPEELSFWYERAAKIRPVQEQLCTMGLPNLIISTSVIPEQVRVIIGEIKKMFEKKQEITLYDLEKNSISLEYVKQLISVVVEGHEAIGIYHLLRNSSRFFKRITGLSIDEECLLQILCQMKDVIKVPFKFNDKTQQFSVSKLFEIIQLKYDGNLYHECQFGKITTSYFQLNDPSLLQPWQNLKNIQLTRSLRTFILEYSDLVKKFLDHIDSKDFNQAQLMYEQMVTAKNSFVPKKQSPIRQQPKQSQVGNDNQSGSKTLINTQVKGQKSLKDFYKEKDKKQPTPFQEETLTQKSIFRTLPVKDCKNHLNWNQQRQEEFEAWLNTVSKTNHYYLTIKDHLQLQPAKRKEQIQPRRKYYMIYDSQKHLNGCILTKQSKKINPKQPFYKDEEIIDYDLDSEIEVQELLAVDVSFSSKSSSSDTDSLNSEDQKFIADNQLNSDLLNEYNINKTYNQMLTDAVTSGNYQPFQLIRKKAVSPEIEEHFHKYMITPLFIEHKFPISIDKQQKSDIKKQENFFDNGENLKDLLLFTHGKLGSKSKLAEEYIKLNPAARKIHVNRKISENCSKDSKKRYMIQDRVLDLLKLTKDAEEILSQRVKTQSSASLFDFQAEQNHNLSQVLQQGTNLFQNTQELFGFRKDTIQELNYEKQ